LSSSDSSSLLSTAVTFAVLQMQVGRQPLLAWMGLAMSCLMAAAAAILGTGLPPAAAAAGVILSPTSTALLMVVLCLWQVSFWSSWGPCFYVVLSELYPLQSRARGVGWGMVTFNLGVVVVLSLGGSMLCAMSYGLLVFFAGVNLYLALFAAAVLPETKSRGLHEVAEVYRHHWLWKHAYRSDSKQQQQ
jgi:MFS family permease